MPKSQSQSNPKPPLIQPTRRGNLSTKSLASIVDPRTVVQDSEYIETHLIAVPNSQEKEFLKNYETVAPMVVPRSASLVASDNEFTLYAVTTFKKHSVEFVHKARENKWIPRDFKYVEGGKEEERKEVERVGGDERKVWGETLRLGRTAWSEAVMVWIHVLVLRVFVETVLRYGLPLDFVSALVRVSFCPLSFAPPFMCAAAAAVFKPRSAKLKLTRPIRPPLPSKRIKQRRTSTTSTPTSPAMPSAATRRVACSGMTRKTCTEQARAVRSTRRMCSTNLNSIEQLCWSEYEIGMRAGPLTFFLLLSFGFGFLLSGSSIVVEIVAYIYHTQVHRAQTSIYFYVFFVSI